MTFTLALQEQYRTEYWQEKKTKLHGTVFSNKYNPLLISALLSKVGLLSESWTAFCTSESSGVSYMRNGSFSMLSICTISQKH